MREDERREQDGEVGESDIVEKIFQAVLEQRLLPGTKLSESDLCELFDVGRMRVRRALLILSSRGIVELHPNKGAFIASYDTKEAIEIFNARLLLETAIIKDICATITKEQCAALEAHIAEEAKARQDDDITSHVRLSGLFHVKLAALLGNAVLTEMVRELVTRTSLIVARFGVSHHRSCNEQDHSLLIDALAKGDARKAQALIEEHLDHIQQSLVFGRSQPSRTALGQMLS